MAPHSSTVAWKIPWTEEPGGLQSMGSLGVGHNSSDLASKQARPSFSQSLLSSHNFDCFFKSILISLSLSDADTYTHTHTHTHTQNESKAAGNICCKHEQKRWIQGNFLN